jgi:surface antigen
MGRPPVLPKKKKDGFWLEIRNKGAKTGTVIIRDTYDAMMQAARQYQNTKDVILLGEHKNGKKVVTKGAA